VLHTSTAACLLSRPDNFLPADPQVPYRPFLPEEEEPGEPVASYSYALADAAAKARGMMQGHEVGAPAAMLWCGGWLELAWVEVSVPHSQKPGALQVMGADLLVPRYQTLARLLAGSTQPGWVGRVACAPPRPAALVNSPAGAPGVAGGRLAGGVAAPAAAGRGCAVG
jgi:hypothetical protein